MTLAVTEKYPVRVFHFGQPPGSSTSSPRKATASSLDISPDGRWLATATGAISQVWRVGSWQQVLVVRRDDPEIPTASMAFTQDGSVVALEQSRRVVKLIEVATGRNLAQMEAVDVPFCRPLCFNRDGTLLATMGGPELLQVWDLRAIRSGLKAIKLDWSSVGAPAALPPAAPRVGTR